VNRPIQIDLEVERRDSPRFPWVVEIRGSNPAPLQAAEQDPILLQGVTENIGNGGVELRSDRPLSSNAVLRCEFAVSGNPVSIPTLMQVRWSDRAEGKGHYKLGLQFLI
jgi:hypothetical protein